MARKKKVGWTPVAGGERMLSKMEVSLAICLQRVPIRHREDLAQECRIYLLQIASKWDHLKSSWVSYASMKVRFFLKDRLRELDGGRRKHWLRMCQVTGSCLDQEDRNLLDPGMIMEPGRDIEELEQFESLIRPLPGRLREVLRLYFSSGLRMREIAVQTGISQARVSQLIATACHKLRKIHDSKIEAEQAAG